MGRSRSSYHHGDLKAALVQAGTRLLAQRGVAGLSLREVAKAAGVSHAAPYRHFEDKQQLLAAIAAAGFDRLRVALTAAASEHVGDPRAQLLAAGRAYVQLARTDPETTQLMFGGSVDPQHVRAELGESAGEAFGALTRIVAAGQSARVFVDADPYELAITAWSVVHGLGMLVAAGQLHIEDEGLDLDALIERVIDRSITGLLRRPDGRG